MRFPFSRTISAAARDTQETLFSAFGFEAVVERRERAELVRSMGFAHQFEEHRRFEFGFVRARGLKPSDRVLEIGFGPLTLGVPIIGYLDAGGYAGVDVRASVANLAYKEIARHDLAGKNPRLVVANDFGAKALAGEQFDMAIAFSVLYHLDDALVETLFARIARALRPGSAFYAQINEKSDESRWLEFPFLKRPSGFYEEIASRNGLLPKALGTLGDLGLRLEAEERASLMLEFSKPA